MTSAIDSKNNDSSDPGEQTIRKMSQHPIVIMKATFIAIVLSLALYLIVKSMYSWAPLHSKSIDILLIFIYLAFFIPLVLVPYVKWATTKYIITDQRIITRTGLIKISGESIPLDKINSVKFTKSFIDRLFNSGSIVIESAAKDEAVLKHVRGAENVTNEVYQFIAEFKRAE